MAQNIFSKDYDDQPTKLKKKKKKKFSPFRRGQDEGPAINESPAVLH